MFGGVDRGAADKLGIDAAELDGLRKIVEATDGDLVIMVGNELSPEAQAMIAGSAGSFASDSGRVLLHPLPLYNNSVGAIDVLPDATTAADAAARSKALLVAGSLQDPELLNGKDFVVVQELFETETTAFADVVFPAASFAEVDGTFTNNAGNVQRVRRSIDALHQAKPDWMITDLIARAMGADLGLEASASGIFRKLADSVPAYAGLRYPTLKDESNPVQANYSVERRDTSEVIDALRKKADALGGPGVKITETPRIGHKLHRLTTMTSKTAQFHLLAHGNPKPANLLLAPLEQFDLDGNPKAGTMARPRR